MGMVRNGDRRGARSDLGNYAAKATEACATVEGGGTADPGVCRLLTET